jgi:uncharacterized protein YqeY
MMTMSIKNDLQEALKVAMKSGQDLRKTTLRMALAAVKNAEVDERAELDDDRILSLLQKEVKARHETIEGARQAERPDLISKAEEEIAVLNEFLPQPLSSQELRDIVAEVVDEVGAESMNDVGKVMGVLMPRIRGKADGKEANQIVRELLGSG